MQFRVRSFAMDPGDLNNAWYERCRQWLEIGLEILDDTRITSDYRASRDAVMEYIRRYGEDPTLCGVLILDALTLHDSETNKIGRTLR